MQTVSPPKRIVRLILPALAVVALGAGITRADYYTQIIAQSPFEYYRLADTSAEIDSPANDLTANAVVLGSTSTPALDPTGGFAGFGGNTWGDFDGSGSSTVTDVATGWDSQSGAISYWINHDSAANTTMAGMFANATGGGESFTSTNDAIGTFSRDNGSFGFVIDGVGVEASAGTLALDQWQHVAFTWDRMTGAGDGVVRVYLNGGQVASTTTATWDSFTIDNAARFGKELTGSSRILTGHADEIAVFDTALSAADIQNQTRSAHLQPNAQQLLRYSFEQPGTVIEGSTDTVLDVSGANNDGVTNNGSNTAAVIDGERGDVMSIASAGLQVDLDSTSRTYTFVGWYKGTDSDGYFFDQESSRFVLSGGGSVGGASLGVYDGAWHDTNLDGFRDGDWHHIAFTFNTTNGDDVFTAYVDGSPTAQNGQVLTNGIVDLDSTGRQVFAANFAVSANGMNGLFDEIAVWDRAMTPGEINELIIKPQVDGIDRIKVMAVDIGGTGQVAQFSGLADEFDTLSASTASGGIADGQSTTVNGVAATLTSGDGTLGYRNRDGVSHTVGDLLNDIVFADADIFLTLSGLKAGVYDLVLYSHDEDGAHDDFAVLVDGIDTGVIVEASIGAAPAVIGFGIVTFTADGINDVVITLDQLTASSSDANIVFNGFELYHVVPAPAALPAGLAMLGLAAARRRPR